MSYSEVAQSVEQVTVNHWVIGSSPILGELSYLYLSLLHANNIFS